MTAAVPRGARLCSTTGFALTAADHGSGWRVTKDQYVQTSGITGVLVNDRVGALPPGAPDRRGRYDTVGRTVYFADTAKTALAEVLQHFRAEVMAMTNDAAAVGRKVADYRRSLTTEFRDRGLPAPGEVSVDWQMANSLYRVDLPGQGWWVDIDHPATLNALSAATHGTFGQLTLASVCGDDRALTTQLAQLIRETVLDDGSLPLGISFPSKTAYGRCWAWWNRRADDNLTPGRNDPKLVESLNVAVPELDVICAHWQLVLVGA